MFVDSGIFQRRLTDILKPVDEEMDRICSECGKTYGGHRGDDC
jgi:hypothetical protein